MTNDQQKIIKARVGVLELAKQLGKLLSPTKRRTAVEHVRDALGRERVSERRACKVLQQPRSTQRRHQQKRRRLWLNDGSCVRLRAAHKDHVWSYDFVMDRTSGGRAFRMLTLIDEHTRECLAIDVARRLSSEDVLERLGCSQCRQTQSVFEIQVSQSRQYDLCNVCSVGFELQAHSAGFRASCG